MANKLREIFYPTPEQQQKLYDGINLIIRETYQKYGECCLTCGHCINVQVHQYYDYSTCELDKTLEFGYGMGTTEHRCDKYERQGYLKVEGEIK